MKRIFLFSVLLFYSLPSYTQFFPYSGSLPAAIPDSNVSIEFPVNVAGLPGQINATFGLAEVCLDITHLQISDLKISLTSPDSTTIILSLHNGNGGSNYVSTCFQMNATVAIGSALPPIFGSYLPDQSLNLLNNGQNPNGIWKLSILDVFPFYSGLLNSWSLTFSVNPPPDPVISNICTTINSSGCVCKDTSLNDCDLLPDLICSYVIIRDGWNEYPGVVDLPNAVIDIGSGPVEMRPTSNCFCDTTAVPCSTSICPGGNPPLQRVTQRIYHKNPNGIMTHYDVPAGNQSFHPTHNHVHAEDFTEFSLRVPTLDPNPETWPVIGSAIKQGYCMLNMGTCNTIDSICMSNGALITDSMLPNLNLGIVTGCGSQGQGLFVGRYDLYGAGFGQSIPVSNLCNGDYYLVTRIDPFNNFTEEDETNNVIAIPVHLTQQTGVPLDAAFTYSTSGLTAAFFNYTQGVSRTWDFGDGTSVVSVLPTHQYAIAGTYTVKLTVSDSTCSTTSAQIVVVGNIGTGINDAPSGLNNVKLFPNPSNSEFKVSWELINPSSVRLVVYDVVGKIIKESFSPYTVSGKFETPVSGLAPGSYQVKVIANDHSITKRTVVLR